jgi:hypothetical protein
MALANGSTQSLMPPIVMRRAHPLDDSIFDRMLVSRVLGRNTLAIPTPFQTS